MQQLNWLTAAVFRVTGCVDVARVDFRLDAEDGDKPYILEVNPLPGLYPGLSDLVLEADAMGMPYDELINAIFDAARAARAIAPQHLNPRTKHMDFPATHCTKRAGAIRAIRSHARPVGFRLVRVRGF